MASIKDIKKRADIIQENSTKCKCGHTVAIPSVSDRVLCNWCGHFVFKDAEQEFKYRLKEQMIRKARG